MAQSSFAMDMLNFCRDVLSSWTLNWCGQFDDSSILRRWIYKSAPLSVLIFAQGDQLENICPKLHRKFLSHIFPTSADQCNSTKVLFKIVSLFYSYYFHRAVSKSFSLDRSVKTVTWRWYLMISQVLADFNKCCQLEVGCRDNVGQRSVLGMYNRVVERAVD